MSIVTEVGSLNTPSSLPPGGNFSDLPPASKTRSVPKPDVSDSQKKENHPSDEEVTKLVTQLWVDGDKLTAETTLALVALVQTLCRIRRDRYESWIQDATLALNQSLSGANEQLTAARQKMISSIITQVGSILQAGVDLGGNAVGGLVGWRKSKLIEKDALARDFGQGGPSGSTPAVAKAPPIENIYSDGPGTPPKLPPRNPGMLKEDPEFDLKNGKLGKGGARDNDVDPAQNAANTAAANTRRMEFVSNEQRNLWTKIDRVVQVVSQVGVIAGSATRSAAAGIENEADMATARAAIDRAYAEYINSLQQKDNEQSSDAATLIRGLYDLLVSIESSRHRASAGIFGV